MVPVHTRRSDAFRNHVVAGLLQPAQQARTSGGCAIGVFRLTRGTPALPLEQGSRGSGTVFAYDGVVDADLRSPGTSAAVQGGRATAGNVCDDGSCSSSPVGRYYLTTTSHDGSPAGGACAQGFHAGALAPS